jgi:hypothetical protein
VGSVKLVVVGRLITLVVPLFALIGPALAQKPTQAQIGRQACRSDYQTYLLLQRANWRLGGAALPPAECAERLRAMSAGARRGRRLGAGGPEPEARAGSGCTRIEPAGICLRRPSAADVAATGGDAASPLLRPGLSRLLRRRPAWWRPDHRVLAGEWPLAVEAMPLGVDVGAAGSLEGQISPGFSKGCGR